MTDQKKPNVVQDLLDRAKELSSAPEAAQAKALAIMAECAVHGLGLLAEMVQYQRIQAEATAFAMTAKMQAMPPPGQGGILFPRS